ncbi:hypothetical protein Hc94105_0408 [Helicobacter cinaedi]|uniref:hypothetical protein n=1 Tax=Helicobacter cinaedi TaxID=213 RepID=UPI001F17DE3B|nr:hypothetical protein [Helicobacter cinaedi]BDB66220.1 hypothetical protein Hc94105_0408 [Helicobacter cinaedi]
MSLQNLCAKRELFLTQYADIEKSIQTLRELYKDNNEKLEIIESFDKYMKQKYEVFADLQDMENKRQKIDELDKQIYYAVRAILQYIRKESKATQKKLEATKRPLQELQIHYDTQEFIKSLKCAGKYVGKHLSLLIWIPIVVGALILMCYFAFNAQYLPTISKDSVLYYTFATTILGVFVAFVLSMFFLYPIYAIHRIFYGKPRPKNTLSIVFASIYVSPIVGLFVLIAAVELGSDFIDKEFTTALIITLFMCVGLAIGFLKITLHFSFKEIGLFCLSSFLLLSFYLIIIQMFKFVDFGYFALFSVCLIVCLISCMAVLAFECFNVIKLSFMAGGLFVVVTLFLSGSLIVSKFHIGNYTAKELIFTQEAEKSIAPCQPTYNANNTLAISNVKVISSLGEYILFECNGIEGRRKVPMRFLVGEMLQSNADKDKK